MILVSLPHKDMLECCFACSYHTWRSYIWSKSRLCYFIGIVSFFIPWLFLRLKKIYILNTSCYMFSVVTVHDMARLLSLYWILGYLNLKWDPLAQKLGQMFGYNLFSLLIQSYHLIFQLLFLPYLYQALMFCLCFWFDKSNLTWASERLNIKPLSVFVLQASAMVRAYSVDPVQNFHSRFLVWCNPTTLVRNEWFYIIIFLLLCTVKGSWV